MRENIRYAARDASNTVDDRCGKGRKCRESFKDLADETRVGKRLRAIIRPLDFKLITLS